MLALLKDHPFAVQAHFSSSLVLTFALPKEKLQPLIPECLTLDMLSNEHAFLAVAMVQTTDLRPKGFPSFLGSDFFLIGYRIFVRYTNNEGKRLRGLYILRSETDSKWMEYIGNLFTRYKYTTTDILQEREASHIAISSAHSGFNVKIEVEEEAILPADSPFIDWNEARRFAGPLPFTFSYDKVTKRVLIIEGVRQNWTPKAVNVMQHDFPFLHAMGFDDARLANAFVIRDIPYSWKKGRSELWKG
jgi:hypothetical protein